MIAVVDGNGQLTGINGIDLLGDTWNVNFIEDSAINIFGTGLVFDFFDANDALLAAIALRTAYNDPAFDTVYTTTPLRTFGINEQTGWILTPYDSNSTTGFTHTQAFGNNTGTMNDGFINLSLLSNAIPIADTIAQEDFVYADWTLASAVPLPAAAYLMGTALLGLMGFSRKNKAQLTA